AKHNRVFSYVFYTLTDFRFGKDIRLYNGKDMMTRQADYWANSQTEIWREQAEERVKNDYLGDIVNALRDGISYFYMGYRTLKKYISLGEFTMCVASASKLYQSLLGIGEGVRQINEKCNYAYQYIDFMEYPNVISKGERKAEDKPHIIEFKDVSFKYPGSDNFVLKHVSIKIDSKEHLSIVGLNGAGKTTFIKLLCRLYDVTEGEILIDGVNIKEYSDEEYKKLFAVVFQDFKLFAFSMRDNIIMGDITAEPTQEKIEEALKLSGLYEDAMNLDNGLDTLLFKSFDEKGTELSGGQQQKTAISRALYRNAPIIILDEPTVALDPMAEYEIYSKFDTLVGNKSAIYISHRLSSCKFCDKIAVFADKTIKEYGTHNELLKIPDGIYSEMFRTQAQYYIEAGMTS
ncbi:MAG: ABC transporter ATP-binding protein, partial [Lachnospiraceae bacterium]|nr:ABC transporter ATP-binding protein [Lachnospiraceae bacterium]